MLLKNGANRLVQLRVTTNLQFVKNKQINKKNKPKNKNALSAKHNKVKLNQRSLPVSGRRGTFKYLLQTHVPTKRNQWKR